MTESRQLYLVLAGGGAAGAYIAGVLTALHRHLSERPFDARGRKVELAGIAGTSAGALSAALFARAVLDADRDRLDALHRAWVRVYDIGALTSRPPGRIPPRGLLDAEPIVAVFRKMLDPPNQGARWADFCGDRLSLVFGAANLNGIPRPLPIRGATPVHAVRHRDALEFTFVRHEAWERAYGTWLRIREWTPASSAAPLFFPARTVPRTRSDYPRDVSFPPEADLGRTTFVDGGLFLNEPVDLALRLTGDATRSGKAVDLVLVDPIVDYGRYAELSRRLRISEVLHRSASAVRNEAARGDWMVAGERVPDLHPVHPSSPPAGAFLGGFGGLFRRKWREHDFRLGVADGQREFRRMLGVGDSRAPAAAPRPPRPEPGLGVLGLRERSGLLLFGVRRVWHVLGAELEGRRRWIRPFLLALILLNGLALLLLGRRRGS